MEKQKEEEMREMKVKQELEENQKIFEQQKTKIEQEIQRKIEQDKKLLQQQAKNEEEKRNFFFEERKEQKNLEEEQKSTLQSYSEVQQQTQNSFQMTANQQEFQRQTELHCNTVNIVNTIINQNQEEVSSSSKIHEDNTELFVTDKNETKVMEELFDKLVAEESTPGLDKLVRSRSFDAVEKWLQNSSSHQDQTAGTKGQLISEQIYTKYCQDFCPSL